MRAKTPFDPSFELHALSVTLGEIQAELKKQFGPDADSILLEIDAARASLNEASDLAEELENLGADGEEIAP